MYLRIWKPTSSSRTLYTPAEETCMYIHTYTYMHTYTHICTYTRGGDITEVEACLKKELSLACQHRKMCAYIHIHIRLHIHTYAYILTHTSAYTLSVVGISQSACLKKELSLVCQQKKCASYRTKRGCMPRRTSCRKGVLHTTTTGTYILCLCVCMYIAQSVGACCCTPLAERACYILQLWVHT